MNFCQQKLPSNASNLQFCQQNFAIMAGQNCQKEMCREVKNTPMNQVSCL